MIDLRNKTILITGASSGIGRAAAILCDKAGASLILSGRNEEELKKTNAALTRPATVAAADLRNEEGANQLISVVPSLDGFVHCAGIISPLPVKFLRSRHIEDIFSINFNSSVLMSSGLLSAKKLNKGASVVFISSVSAAHPYTGGSMYTASKAALEAFSRGFALEGAAKKIRVNTLAPALVRTKILDLSENMYSKDELAVIESQYPLGIGEPEDVANAIVFLLSNAAKWITGTTIQMDGGLLLNSK